MTNKTITGLARPLAALLLFAGCNQQSGVQQQAAPAISAGGAPEVCDSPETLSPCDPPALEPLDHTASRTAMLPVAYPGDELAAPAHSAPRFTPVDPQLPLPPGIGEAGRPFQSMNNEVVRQARKPDRRDPRRVEKPAIAPLAKLPEPPRHPEAMQAVNQRAEQMIRRGYHLAERGALYSGRAEFVQVLSTIAQTLDLEAASREHSEALAAGLTALEEAEDFVALGPSLETDLDLPALIRAHRTPVCKAMNTRGMLSVTVLQQYYSYAQQQLAIAAGGQEAASMAMLGLGKTYSTLALEKTLPAAVAEPKAMVFHWAALSAHPGNFMAANELAVLEARWGQLATARSLLQYSVTILPHSAVWQNLATVHDRLGESKLADLARQEAEIAAKREAEAKPGNPDGIVPSTDVAWLDAKTFAATSRSEIDPQKSIAAGQQGAMGQAKPAVAPAPPRQRSAAAWFPWLR